MVQLEFHHHLIDKKGSKFVFQWAKIVFKAQGSMVSWKSSSHATLCSVLFPFE